MSAITLVQSLNIGNATYQVSAPSNNIIFVGPTYPTIQRAVTAGLTAGALVIIPFGATPVDTIAQAHGSPTVVIIDQRVPVTDSRGLSGTYYTWISSAYVATPTSDTLTLNASVNAFPRSNTAGNTILVAFLVGGYVPSDPQQNIPVIPPAVSDSLGNPYRNIVTSPGSLPFASGFEQDTILYVFEADSIAGGPNNLVLSAVAGSAGGSLLNLWLIEIAGVTAYAGGAFVGTGDTVAAEATSPTITTAQAGDFLLVFAGISPAQPTDPVVPATITFSPPIIPPATHVVTTPGSVVVRGSADGFWSLTAPTAGSYSVDATIAVAYPTYAGPTFVALLAFAGPGPSATVGSEGSPWSGIPIGTVSGSSIFQMPPYPLAPQSLEFTATDIVAVSVSPFSAQQQSQDWQQGFLEVSISMPPLTQVQAQQWIAFMMSLRGQLNVFMWGDPLAIKPAGSALGSPVATGGSGFTLSTSGWTPGAVGVLLPGDWLQVGFRLYRTLQQVNADTSGNALVYIWPPVREAPTGPLVLNRAQGLFRLKNNARKWSETEARYYGLQFEIREALFSSLAGTTIVSQP